MKIINIPTKNVSKNFIKNAYGLPKMVVIHGTFGSTLQGSISWLTTDKINNNSSAHFIIAKNGDVYKLAEITDKTWHAGNISNPSPQAKRYLIKNLLGYVNPNNYSIGIEMEFYQGDTDFTTEQWQSLVELFNSFNLNKPIVLTHSQIADYKGDFGRDDFGIEFVLKIQKNLGVNKYIV